MPGTRATVLGESLAQSVYTQLVYKYTQAPLWKSQSPQRNVRSKVRQSAMYVW